MTATVEAPAHNTTGIRSVTATPVTPDPVVARLSKASVDKHFDAYEDVDWDSPEMAIDPTDPRFVLFTADPLGATEWYRNLPVETRARFGLQRVCHSLTVGWQFENILQRGLLDYSMRNYDDSTTFRYLQHEIAEESQHTMMFREFVARAGLDLRGMPRKLVFIAEHLTLRTPRRFPELFFLFVLGGEDPADYLQRRQLKEAADLHPLIERIMRIHVTEESRHLSFARHFLRDRVGDLSWGRRAVLSVIAPITLGVMARTMCYPGDELVAEFAIPDEVLHEAYDSPAGRRMLAESVAKPRRLCVKLGLVNAFTRPLWKQMGIWDDADDADTTAPAAARESAIAA